MSASESFDRSTTLVSGNLAGTGALHHDSTPETPGTSLPRTPPRPPPAQLRPLSRFVATIRAHASICTALVWGAVALAAAIEDPPALPRFRELRNGLFGLIGAGGIVVGVVIIENVAEGVDLSIEGWWGRAWRWIRRDEEQGKQDEKTDGEEDGGIFEGDKNAYILPDMPLATSSSTQWSSSSSQRQAQLQQNFYRLIPAFAPSPLPWTRPLSSPPSPSRQEYAYTSSPTQSLLNSPVPRRRAEHNVSSSQFFPDASHGSGLLGPSPMPARCTGPEWEHFSGHGFRRHEQRLRAVNVWAMPGRRTRTFDEILKEVETMDERDRETYE